MNPLGVGFAPLPYVALDPLGNVLDAQVCYPDREGGLPTCERIDATYLARVRQDSGIDLSVLAPGSSLVVESEVDDEGEFALPVYPPGTSWPAATQPATSVRVHWSRTVRWRGERSLVEGALIRAAEIHYTLLDELPGDHVVFVPLLTGEPGATVTTAARPGTEMTAVHLLQFRLEPVLLPGQIPPSWTRPQGAETQGDNSLTGSP